MEAGHPATDDASPAGGNRETRGHSLRRAGYLTAAMGIVHAILFLASIWLISRTPGARSSEETLTAFYASGKQRLLIVVGLYSMPFAGIAFIWLTAALRMWIGGGVRRENALISNIQRVS